MNPFIVLRDAGYFFNHHLADIARLCLPALLLEAIGQYLLLNQWGAEASRTYSVLLGVALYPLYAAPLIVLLQARSNGANTALRTVWLRAISYWPQFAVLATLSTLLITLGLSLYILPGIWIMVRLVLAENLLLVHGLSPLKALRASFILTRGRFFPLLSCLIVVMAPLLVLDWLSATEADNAFLWIAQHCAAGFVQLLSIVVAFRLFMILTTQPASNP